MDEQGNSNSTSTEKPVENEPPNHTDVVIDNSKQIMERIARLYADRLLSDVDLCVGGKSYAVHRLILCASSDVFQVMLMDQNWSESQESQINLQEDPRCEIVFPSFIQYLYTGLLRVTHETVLPLLILADKYNIRHLITLCLDYMSSHLISACSCNVLLSWLHYCNSCSHVDVASKAALFVAWNFELVVAQKEFWQTEPDLLLSFLLRDDLVVKDEFFLFEVVSKWLLNQENRFLLASATSNNGNESPQMTFADLVELFAKYIRFPMMSSRELAKLLLNPLVQRFNSVFVNRMSHAMSFHEGDLEKLLKMSSRDKNLSFLCCPRLYTNEKWSSSLVIDSYSNIPIYGSRSLVFTTPQSLFDKPCACGKEHSSHGDNRRKSTDNLRSPDNSGSSRKKSKVCHERDDEWVVELHPKGIWFQKCLLIRMRNWEVPEVVIKTARLSVAPINPCISSDRSNSSSLYTMDKKVRVAILIYGLQDEVEYVKHTRIRTIFFCPEQPVLQLNDLIPYDELNLPTPTMNQGRLTPHSSFLVGKERDTLKILVIITPVNN